jgi:hypothetical protein
MSSSSSSSPSLTVQWDLSPEPDSEEMDSEAVWTSSYVSNLPDSSFAWIEPGGKKDSEGKTTPRSLRHLPYKDSSGKPDAAHVRNALARFSQTKGVPASAKSKLISAAKSLGIGDYEIEDIIQTGLVREVKIREFTLEEKLEWLAPGALERLKEFNRKSGPDGGKFYYIKAIHPTISGNYRNYTQDELTRFARTLIGKYGDINHGPHLQDTTIVDAEYSNREKAVELIVYSQNPELNQLYQTRQIIGASIEADPRFSEPSQNGLMTTPKGMIGKGIAFVTSGEMPGDPTTKVELLETLNGTLRQLPGFQQHPSFESVLKTDRFAPVRYIEETTTTLNEEPPPQFVTQNKAPKSFGPASQGMAPGMKKSPEPSSGGAQAPADKSAVNPGVQACIMKLTSMGVDQDDASLLCQNAKEQDDDNNGDDGDDDEPDSFGQPTAPHSKKGIPKTVKNISRSALGSLAPETLERLADRMRIELLKQELEEYKKKPEHLTIADALKASAEWQNIQNAVSQLAPLIPQQTGDATAPPKTFEEWKKMLAQEIIGEFKQLQIRERQNAQVTETTLPPSLKDRLANLEPQDREKYFKGLLRETPLRELVPKTNYVPRSSQTTRKK